MKNTILKNKKFIVSIIVLLIAVFGFAGYKFYINSKAVDGIKEYKIIVTDSDKTFSEEFDVTTKEKSLGEDLDKRKLIESENGSYGRFVTEVNGRKADESKQECWNLVVNGESSSTGIDDVMINDGDTVEFILTTGW
ncbi:Conserved hypothetical protein [Clostridium neonatale]|uniref:DUF4430 domain-containing protein n=1 Tax=Clostridium neonatale TaxID=137838 RepID=UPI00291C058E|nr:DUF4430 domain-containing protein [Clostridium neonatale]CAI3613487.1 Conserved hypothetical protein [Clostridium neonatale]